MKKIFALLIAITILTAVAAPTFAQGRSCRNRNYDSRNYNSTYYDPYYDNSRAYYDYGTQRRGRSFWDQHRDKLTVGGGTLGGAILVSLIAGRRGPLLAALPCRGVSRLHPS